MYTHDKYLQHIHACNFSHALYSHAFILFLLVLKSSHNYCVHTPKTNVVLAVYI